MIEFIQTVDTNVFQYLRIPNQHSSLSCQPKKPHLIATLYLIEFLNYHFNCTVISRLYGNN